MRCNSRNVTVDVTRSFAILLMVAFHFIYDLRIFGYHDWNIPNGQGWKQWRWVIVSLFLLCVGIGLVYGHANAIKWKTFSYRFSQIAAGAIAISIVTYVMYPEHWIYFGILHFIALASVLSIPLITRPRIALVAALVLLVATYFGYANIRWPYYQLFPNLPWRPNDFVPLIPWLSVVWIGIAIGHSRWLRQDPLVNLPYQQTLARPGQHSLIIYLAHQPVLFAAFYFVKFFLDPVLGYRLIVVISFKQLVLD